MTPIIAALISQFGFLVIALLNKRRRAHSVATLSLLAAYGVTIPVWLLMMIWQYAHGNGVFSSGYLAYVAIWFVACVAVNFGSVYLVRFQSMSESTGLNFAFSNLWAILIDWLAFGAGLQWQELTAIFITVSGATTIAFKRRSGALLANIAPWKKIAAVIGITACSAITLFAYKKGISYQPSIFFHIAFTHALLLSTYALVGAQCLKSDLVAGRISPRHLVCIFFLLLVSVISLSIAIAGLPLVILILFTLVSSAIYLAHDVIAKEFHMTPIAVLGCFLTIIGIIAMALLKN